MITVTGVQRKGRSAGIVGKCFTSGTPMYPISSTGGVLLQAPPCPVHQACPSTAPACFYSGVQGASLNSVLFSEVGLVQLCSHAATPELFQAPLEPRIFYLT